MARTVKFISAESCFSFVSRLLKNGNNTASPIRSITSGQRALRVANVFLISAILFCQLEVFWADELSHLSAEVQVGVDGKLSVSGCIDLAFVGFYRYINRAFAFVALADTSQ